MMKTIEDSPVQSVHSPVLSSSPSIEKSDDDPRTGQTKSYSSSGEIDTKLSRASTAQSKTNGAHRTNTNKSLPPVNPTPTNPPQSNEAPAFMGDILDDIFGGSFRTPGVKASEDILKAKTITAALAFEELESIRNSPTLFVLFYNDAKEHSVLESLHFILEVEEFAQLPLDFRMTREKEIIDNYLTTGARNEINIPDNTRRNVNEKMGTKCEDIFTEVQKYITHMLIRNVDITWNYKKAAPPKKELKKGKLVKKAIDKLTEDQRIRDLVIYFLAGRITPLMYQARTSVVSLQRKVRTTAPIGWAIVKINQISGFTSKPNINVYVVGQCYYQNQAGILRDKKSVVKTVPRKCSSEFKLDEELKFDVKEIDTQVIEVCLWEKRFLPDVVLVTFTLELANLIERNDQDLITELKITLDEGMGEILVDFLYKPNQEELLRLQQEREKREQQSRSPGVSPEFDFLMS